VTLTRLIPERHRALAKEVVTFGTVGAINTIVGQLIFDGLLGLGPSPAAIISTAIATVLSYVLNRHITYRHRPRTSVRRELPLFAGFNIIALGIQLGVLNLSRYTFNLADDDRLGLNLARFGGAAVGTVFLLLTYRTFVFKKRKPETAVVEALTEAVEVSSIVLVQPRVDADDFIQLTTPLEAELAQREPANDEEPATTSAK
jgi:putative flippase GtrA